MLYQVVILDYANVVNYKCPLIGRAKAKLVSLTVAVAATNQVPVEITSSCFHFFKSDRAGLVFYTQPNAITQNFSSPTFEIDCSAGALDIQFRTIDNTPLVDFDGAVLTLDLEPM
jgi:hypothetical protein